MYGLKWCSCWRQTVNSTTSHIPFCMVKWSRQTIFPGMFQWFRSHTHMHTHTHTTMVQFGIWHRFGGIYFHWLWKEVHEICPALSWWISSPRISTGILQVSIVVMCMCWVSGAYVHVFCDGVSIHFCTCVYCIPLMCTWCALLLSLQVVQPAGSYWWGCIITTV